MLFNSLPFLIFAPTFFLAYFLLAGRARLWLCLTASYFFYSFWDWRFTSLLLISTAVDFNVGRALGRTDDEGKRLLLLYLSLAANLGMLGTFKYFDFFAGSMQVLLDSVGIAASMPLLKIALPIGISFYTFQTLSYTIDVYRRKLTPTDRLLDFAVYVALFPQLVAGPIVRASSLLPQLLERHRFDAERIARGLELVLWGFFLKLCLADNLAGLVERRFAYPHLFGGLSHLISITAFYFQLYGDFAGYSLIAIGLGRMMGFDFGINFDRPFFASSYSEFWRRWHISLSTWIRDYLYIPLVSRRDTRSWRLFVFVLTMFLAGLWHGASWNFAIWGLWMGAYMVLERFFKDPLLRLSRALHLPAFAVKLAAILLVFCSTGLTQVAFRAPDIPTSLTVLDAIFTWDGFFFRWGRAVPVARGFAIVAFVILFDAVTLNARVRDYYLSRPWLRWLGAAALIWLILLTGSFQGERFIYFQF